MYITASIENNSVANLYFSGILLLERQEMHCAWPEIEMWQEENKQNFVILSVYYETQP